MTPPSVEYREIPLTKGQVAYVSPHRYEELMRFKWYAWWSKQMKQFYAERTVRPIGEKKQTILMHRQILGLLVGDRRTGDHKNRKETLDNTDENLRIATYVEQAQHRGIHKNCVSGYKGVIFCPKMRKYRVRIFVEGKYIDLGYFDDPKDGDKAYREAALKYFGEFAYCHSDLIGRTATTVGK